MNIISTVTAQATALQLTKATQGAATNVFESLLDSFGTGKSGGDYSFLEIASSMTDLLVEFQTNILAKPVDFPFSSAFTSTFGISGPLPTFIAATSANLKLNAAQQLALQNIAINNKDIVKSPESIQKISKELQAAGIGYA